MIRIVQQHFQSLSQCLFDLKGQSVKSVIKKYSFWNKGSRTSKEIFKRGHIKRPQWGGCLHWLAAPQHTDKIIRLEGV